MRSSELEFMFEKVRCAPIVRAGRTVFPIFFHGGEGFVPIPLVESALLPSAIEGSCDLSPIVNLIFLIYLPFIVPV